MAAVHRQEQHATISDWFLRRISTHYDQVERQYRHSTHSINLPSTCRDVTSGRHSNAEYRRRLAVRKSGKQDAKKRSSPAAKLHTKQNGCNDIRDTSSPDGVSGQICVRVSEPSFVNLISIAVKIIIELYCINKL